MEYLEKVAQPGTTQTITVAPDVAYDTSVVQSHGSKQ
jgi:hypothetical protein